MRNVRYWHKADIACALQMSAFGGKADITISFAEHAEHGEQCG